LTILCFFFTLVWGLPSQYFSIFPSVISEGILSWTFVSLPPSLLPVFPVSRFDWLCFSCLPGAQTTFTFCLGGFLHSHSLPLCQSPDASLVRMWASLGSWQVSISSWLGLDSGIKFHLKEYEDAPQLWMRTPPSLHVSNTSYSHIIQPPISCHKDNYLVTSMIFLVLVCAQYYMVSVVLVFRAFSPELSKNSGVYVLS
jgi:hypothetical protein